METFFFLVGGKLLFRMHYLAGVTRFSKLPATVPAAAADEGRIAAEHDVEDDSQAPEVAALVIDGSLFAEGLDYLRCHVLC